MPRHPLKFSVLIAIILMLAGCATRPTTADYDAVLNTWVGQSERDLVLRWGIPDREYSVDPRTRLISYKSQRKVHYPGSYPTCFGHPRRDPFMTNCTGGIPPTVEYLTCETTFTSISGKITSWRRTGNNCR